MGWTSTGDASAHQFNSTMYFDSKEAAMAFCDKHGWEFEVQEPQLMGKGASTIPGAGKAGVRPKSLRRQLFEREERDPHLAAPGLRRRGQELMIALIRRRRRRVSVYLNRCNSNPYM